MYFRTWLSLLYSCGVILATLHSETRMPNQHIRDGVTVAMGKHQ